MVADFLPSFLQPAVQALLLAGWSEGGQYLSEPARRLENAERCFVGDVAKGGGRTLILYFGYAVISIWVFDDCILFAFLLHVFCSATANVLQYHCITVAVVLHIGVQCHCNDFAVALQNVCRILQ